MKKKFLSLSFAIFMVLFVSCQNDSEPIVENFPQDAASTADTTLTESDVLFLEDLRTSILMEQEIEALNSSNLRGVISKSQKWAVGSVIRIKFLNGSAAQQNAVKQYAAEWLKPNGKAIRLSYKYVGVKETADVRISFNAGGSWSYVGTDCKYIAQNTATMNFGWLNSKYAQSEWRRTIVHEFGHLLGLKHEHQSPVHTIKWNTAKVYAYFKKTQGWTNESIDRNVLTKLNSAATNYSSFDKYSIMAYSIPASITTNNVSIPFNTVMSATDKAFIYAQYK